MEKDQFKAAAFAEILRLIKEVDPPIPSSRLSGSGSLPSVAAHRRIDPVRLTRSIAGDLDWVIMKALEKDRGRRYESANGLAEDIQRHLCDEPVSASPPSVRYRMQKFVKRNRAGVIAVGTLAAAMLLGIVGTTYGMLWAIDEKQQAENRLVQIGKSNEILGSIFENLDPEVLVDKDSRLRLALVDNLKLAVEQLDGESIGDPEMVAKLQLTVGWSLYRLAEFEKAFELTKQASETLTELDRKAGRPPSRETLASKRNLCWCMGRVDRYQIDEAITLARETFELSEQHLGARDPDTVISLSNLGHLLLDRDNDVALPLLEKTLPLAMEVLGPKDQTTLETMAAVGDVFHLTGQSDKALPLLERVVELVTEVHGEEHPATLRHSGNLAVFYMNTGRIDQVVRLLEKLLSLTERTLGPQHTQTNDCKFRLAVAYKMNGKQEQLADHYLKDVITFWEDRSQPENAMEVYRILGSGYMRAGKPELGLPHLINAYKYQMSENILSSGGVTYAADLALCYLSLKSYPEAEEAILGFMKANMHAEHGGHDESGDAHDHGEHTDHGKHADHGGHEDHGKHEDHGHDPRATTPGLMGSFVGIPVCKPRSELHCLAGESSKKPKHC
ncbi:MAG: tetratricopeptide repeat protein [Fuerstiella sp.]